MTLFLRKITFFFILALISIALVSCSRSEPVSEPATFVPGNLTPMQTSSPTPSATPEAVQAGLNRPSPTPVPNCTYTPYYWQQHPEKWLTENILVGPVSIGKQEAIQLLEPSEDALRQLLREFLATALNIIHGAESAVIQEEINEAAGILGEKRLGSILTSQETSEAISLSEQLGAYNQGHIGPGMCPDEEPTPTPVTPTATYTASPTHTNTPRPFVPPPPTSTPDDDDDGRDDPPPPPPPTDTPPPPPTDTQSPPPTNTPPPANTQPPPPPPSTPTSAPPPPTSTPGV